MLVEYKPIVCSNVLMVQFLKFLIVLVNNALMLVKSGQGDCIRSANLHTLLHSIYILYAVILKRMVVKEQVIR